MFFKRTTTRTRDQSRRLPHGAYTWLPTDSGGHYVIHIEHATKMMLRMMLMMMLMMILIMILMMILMMISMILIMILMMMLMIPNRNLYDHNVSSHS